MDRALLAQVLSERLFGSAPTAEFTATVSALQSTSELRSLVTDTAQQAVAEPGLRRFFSSWLSLSLLDAREQLTPQVRAAVKESSLLFGVDVTRSAGGMQELLTSGEIWLNADLQDTFGISVDAEPLSEFRKAMPERPERNGILTQPGFLVAHNPTEIVIHPIRRGVAVLEALLCIHVPLAPPNSTTSFFQEPAERGVTVRQRLEEHSESATCAACHQLIDSFGLVLENFDALGRHRSEDNGLPIDLSMRAIGTDFEDDYAGSGEFFAAAAESNQVSRCFGSRWLSYLMTGDALENAGLSETVAMDVVDGSLSLAELMGTAASSEPFLDWVREGAPATDP